MRVVGSKSKGFGIVLLLAFGIFSSPGARASGGFIREYAGRITLGAVEIPLNLRVRDSIEETRYGEPEIEGHGFIRKTLEVQMVEGLLSCSSFVEISNGEMKTCSGLRIKFEHPEDLLSERDAAGKVYTASTTVSVGGVRLSLRHADARTQDEREDD